MAYTYQEIGARIKQRNPEALGNFSDEEIGKRAAERNPDLAKMVRIDAPVQTKPPEPKAEEPNVVIETTKDVAKGAGKGVAKTARGLSSLGERFIRGTLKTILPKSAERKLNIEAPSNEIRTGAESLVTDEMIRPTNTAQKVGFGIEQIGEFLLPGGAAAKAGKFAEGAVAAGKTASTLTKGEKVAKGAAKIFGTAAADAAFTGAQVAAQEGRVDENTARAASAAAILSPTASIIGKATEKSSAGLWGTVLQRTQRTVANNPNLEKQIAQNTKLFGTRKMILDQAKSNIQKIEIELDDVLDAADGFVDGKNVASYLDELKKSYSSIPGEKSSVATIENIRKEVIKRGKMTAKEANELKREIYGVTEKSYGKGLLEIPAKADAQKAVARGLKEEIEKLVPETKNLNEKQAIFIQASKAMRRVLAQPRRGIAGTGIGVYDLLLGGIGYGGGDLETAAKLVLGKKVAESAVVRTGLANLLGYFSKLSPTKKALFYNAVKGSIVDGTKQD